MVEIPQIEPSMGVRTVLRPLFPYQERALQYCHTRTHPALYMEMRLGKSIVLIRWALEAIPFPSYKLVVAPLGVLRSWRKELGLEGQSGSVVDLTTMTATEKRKALQYRKPNSWYLVNYEYLRLNPEIAALPWSLVALDESTRIKNPAAQVTKVCTTGFRNAGHRAILSGLPSPEGELDLYCQFLFKDGVFMNCRNFWQFRNTYFESNTHEKRDGYHWTEYIPREGVSEAIRKLVHERAFVLTREQAGIGSPKLYDTRTAQLPSEARKKYRDVEKRFEFEGTETQWAMVASQWMGRIAGGFSPIAPNPIISDHKLKLLVSLFSGSGELKHDQSIVWFRFNEEIRQAQRFLNAKGVTAGIISGEYSPTVRGRVAESFNRGAYQLLLCQGSCDRYGVDYSCADTEIYYSNHYSCEIRSQSEDRLIHPTKKTPVLVLDLITEDTIDEDVVETVQQKQYDAKTLMQNIRKGIERRNARATKTR